MENKKQQTKAPFSPNKSQQEQQQSKNSQLPNQNNKSPAQKKPGSNW